MEFILNFIHLGPHLSWKDSGGPGLFNSQEGQSSFHLFASSFRRKKLGIGGGIGPTPPHTLVTKVTAIGEFHPLIYCDKIFLYTNFNTYPCFITLLGMCSSLSYLFEFNGLNELSNYNLLCQKLNELYICFTTKGEEK